ncbi:MULTISPECIES: hypothetical protein [Halostella]|nr:MULTISPECIES: hypothetical protein [Halostella]
MLPTHRDDALGLDKRDLPADATQAVFSVDVLRHQYGIVIPATFI